MAMKKLKRMAVMGLALIMTLTMWQTPMFAQDLTDGYANELAYEIGDNASNDEAYEAEYEAAHDLEEKYEKAYENAYETVCETIYEANNGVYFDLAPLSAP